MSKTYTVTTVFHQELVIKELETKEIGKNEYLREIMVYKVLITKPLTKWGLITYDVGDKVPGYLLKEETLKEL